MIDLAMIETAAKRLSGVAARTQLLESERLNARFGCRLLIELECLQRTGSFKICGAYNKIASLSLTERKRRACPPPPAPWASRQLS